MSNALKRLLTYLTAGIAIALLLNFLGAQRFFPAAAQFSPSSALSLPEASSQPGDLTGAELSAAIEAFIPPGLAESPAPSDGSRGIFGTDDRIPMTERRYPWSAIGRVVGVIPLNDNTQATTACTGALVSANVVLTNAHCVVNPETHEFVPSVYFQPNLINGQIQRSEDLAIATTVGAATDFRDDNTPPNADDWALLTLDRPLGESYGTLSWQPLPLQTLVEDYRDRLIMVGYSGDFPASNPGETAGVHDGCSILGVYEESLVHDCDTTGGSSGGPILAQVDGAYRIVAVNSAEYTRTLTQAGSAETREVGVANYAVQIPRIVETLMSLQAS